MSVTAGQPQAGNLGPDAKIHTGELADAVAGQPGWSLVICVYTRDWRDQVDVTTALRRLRELGYQGRLSYKEDADTHVDL